MLGCNFKNCEIINGEYLVDKTEKFDVINNEYAKKRCKTKVINGEYLVYFCGEECNEIADSNFKCKELADIFNKNLCKENGERYLAFFRPKYGNQFYWIGNYKYLEIDDFELKYKDTSFFRAIRIPKDKK